jgi:hypothetical protein
MGAYRIYSLARYKSKETLNGSEENIQYFSKKDAKEK